MSPNQAGGIVVSQAVTAQCEDAIVQLRHNFRRYPALVRRRGLAAASACARVVFNDGLRLREEARRAGLAYLRRPSRRQARRAPKGLARATSLPGSGRRRVALRA